MKEIELSKNGWKNRGKYKALVDDSLFDIVNQYDWSYRHDGYAERRDYSTNKPKKILLHRYIYELKYGKIPEELLVDHIDGNRLNCQTSNLRLATKSENGCNIKKQKNNASGFKGISKYVQKQKMKGKTYIYKRWCAEISKDQGKRTEKRYTKYFPYTDDGLAQAKEWYKQKSLELHKDFSIFNKDK